MIFCEQFCEDANGLIFVFFQCLYVFPSFIICKGEKAEFQGSYSILTAFPNAICGLSW